MMEITLYLKLSMQTCNINEIIDIDKEEIEIEKKFITSPADVEIHRKLNCKMEI